jgi:PII-like signaling protein
MDTFEGRKLTIVIQERDRFGGQPLMVAILETLAREGIAAATVTRAVTGFSGASPVHTVNIEVLSFDLPLVIEATDAPEKIDLVLPKLVELSPGAMMDVMPVQMVRGRRE